jgi:hypothetical protein
MRRAKMHGWYRCAQGGGAGQLAPGSAGGSNVVLSAKHLRAESARARIHGRRRGLKGV